MRNRFKFGIFKSSKKIYIRLIKSVIIDYINFNITVKFFKISVLEDNDETDNGDKVELF